MNTITTTASPHASILAIDLGKYKSVACVLGDDTGEFRFATSETSEGRMRELIGQEQPAVVVIEACNISAIRLVRFLPLGGIP